MEDRDEMDKSKSGQHLQFTCPICKRRVSLPREDRSRLPEFFPFCSERCKLIDLGAWLDADYRIPSRPDEESEPPSSKDPSA
ncbi:MAG: hypothetical protein A2Y77_07215, partial [Planctomycetes bacterium RBG_13_62_9]